jgi:hypothetical protein
MTEACNGVDDDCNGVSDDGFPDADKDGFGHPCDNCAAIANVGQENLDADGFGDACDSCLLIPTALNYRLQNGDVDTSGAITSADIIGLVNYVFKSGLEPRPCRAAGDINCNGSITSADVISLVNYVFKSASPPCVICQVPNLVWDCTVDAAGRSMAVPTNTSAINRAPVPLKSEP